MTEKGSTVRDFRPPVSIAVPPRRFTNLMDGCALAFVDAGEGPPVVLIHGALTVLDDMWLGLARVLASRYRVVAFDRPGHGESRRTMAGDGALVRQADLIRQGMRKLHLDRPVLIGHSLGGAVALALATLFPDDVAGVVALAPPCFAEPRLEQMLFGPRAAALFGPEFVSAQDATLPWLLPTLWHAMFLPRLMPASFAAAFPFRLAARSEALTRGGEDANLLASGLDWLAANLPACRVPVRILGGDADAVVANILHGARAVRLIPQGRFDMLPGAGHMLHHFEQARVLSAVHDISDDAVARMAAQ